MRLANHMQTFCSKAKLWSAASLPEKKSESQSHRLFEWQFLTGLPATTAKRAFGRRVFMADTDLRIRKLCDAITEEYKGELAALIDADGRLVVQVQGEKHVG